MSDASVESPVWRHTGPGFLGTFYYINNCFRLHQMTFYFSDISNSRSYRWNEGTKIFIHGLPHGTRLSAFSVCDLKQRYTVLRTCKVYTIVYKFMFMCHSVVGSFVGFWVIILIFKGNHTILTITLSLGPVSICLANVSKYGLVRAFLLDLATW